MAKCIGAYANVRLLHVFGADIIIAVQYIRLQRTNDAITLIFMEKILLLYNNKIKLVVSYKNWLYFYYFPAYKCGPDNDALAVELLNWIVVYFTSQTELCIIPRNINLPVQFSAVYTDL